MKTIDEQAIRFEFGDSWTVVEKWDDSRAFKDGIYTPSSPSRRAAYT